MLLTRDVHVVSWLTDLEARTIVYRELPKMIQKLIRSAHKRGAKGEKAQAEIGFRGDLLDAAICLKQGFEEIALSCVPGEAWHVTFGYTVNHHAPGTMIIRLR